MNVLGRKKKEITRGWKNYIMMSFMIDIHGFFSHATTCPLWTSWTPLPVVAEV
jgi:hypothetical protein